MSSVSSGSCTRERMKFRSRCFSCLTTSEMDSSCWLVIEFALSVCSIYLCRRNRGSDILGDTNKISDGIARREWAGGELAFEMGGPAAGDCGFAVGATAVWG